MVFSNQANFLSGKYSALQYCDNAQVLETAHQVGRMSVSTSDVPYKEMASHCETLLRGKQQKMSDLMHAHQIQDSLMNSLQDQNDEVRKIASSSNAVLSLALGFLNY